MVAWPGAKYGDYPEESLRTSFDLQEDSYYVDLRKKDKPSPPTSAQRISLPNLPTELIRHIVSYLPSSSAGCLAMCNHALLSALGQQYWRYLKADNPEKEAFLLLLQKDLPDWLYHPCCGRMREINNEYERPGRRMKDSLRCLKRAGAIDVDEKFSIRFHHVHALMHRYRSSKSPHQDIERDDGQDNKHMRMLSHRYKSSTFGEGYTVRCRPRVIHDQRRQHNTSRAKLLLSLTYDIPIPRQRVQETIDKNFLPICPHIDAEEEAPAIQCRLRQPKQSSCGYCAGLRNCEVCFTDYEITSSYVSRWQPWRRKFTGLTLHVRIWKDLGECKSIYSPQWWWGTRKVYETDPRVNLLSRKRGAKAGQVKDAYLDGTATSGGDLALGLRTPKPTYWQKRGWKPSLRCVIDIGVKLRIYTDL